MRAENNKNTLIALVEDSEEDYQVLMRIFKRCGVTNPVVHLPDGERAIAYFRTATTLGSLPGVILLDLNLPGTDGREVLEFLKNSELYQAIPVIVLTTSTNSQDIAACYRHGASAYVQKPMELEGLCRVVEKFKEFWLETAILPDLYLK